MAPIVLKVAAIVVWGGFMAAMASNLVSDPDDFHENSPELWALYIALWTVAVAAVLALGVAVNRSAARLRTRSARR